MKLRLCPKILSNLPHNYKLDVGDKRELQKYRNELSTKRRQANRHIIHKLNYNGENYL